MFYLCWQIWALIQHMTDFCVSLCWVNLIKTSQNQKKKIQNDILHKENLSFGGEINIMQLFLLKSA